MTIEQIIGVLTFVTTLGTIVGWILKLSNQVSNNTTNTLQLTEDNKKLKSEVETMKDKFAEQRAEIMVLKTEIHTIDQNLSDIKDDQKDIKRMLMQLLNSSGNKA